MVQSVKLALVIPIVVCVIATTARVAHTQSSTATLTGIVVDETEAVMPGVDVLVENIDTATRRQTKTADDGSFTVPLLPPATYLVTAQREGFTPVEVPNFVLNVNDRVAVRLELKVASVGETVSVAAPSRTTTSAAVGTVIDRQFVGNLPLNGRSLQSLLELTPGVVLTQVGTPAEGGQFSVNGQRSNANYLMVDGVSANVGISAGSGILPGQSVSGQLPAFSALGTTNGLVSVDALQEFRIQTSTYAPEFGRTPGGQISMITRSGTNAFHGSAFEYFRDDALDARDWFTNNKGLEKPELRHHNFGGVLGGPILRNRTFFFASYEKLRLEQPRALTVSTPTLDVRRTAAPIVQPYLNVFPMPNGKDLGGGFAEFSASYSDPSRLDATSVRIDHSVNQRLTFFGRVNHAPSYREARSPSSLVSLNVAHQDTDSITAGSTWIISDRAVHDLRVNYTTNAAPSRFELTTFGGNATPPDSVFAPGTDADSGFFSFGLENGPAWYWGMGSAYEQRQLNIVESLTVTSPTHEWKVGLDYRRMHPLFAGSSGTESLGFAIPGLMTGRASRYTRHQLSAGRRAAVFDTLSLYAQDNWKISPRLTLTYGVRWELAPPPHATEGRNAVTLDGLDDPLGGQVRLAAPDTPLWKTTYNNFAPRIGASYVVSSRPESHLVVKGGFGVFHDLPFSQVGTAYTTYPFFATKTLFDIALPLPQDVLAPPSLGVDTPQQLWLVDRHIKLPYTYQWNVSAEQALGPHQMISIGYIGAEGHRILKSNRYRLTLPDWPTSGVPVFVSRNNGYSDYQALQVQFNRRLHRGLQALMSYSWGRSRDTSSSDISNMIPAERLPPSVDYGLSDYDVRHVLTAGVTYQVSDLPGNGLWRTLARNWGADLMFRARSAFPLVLNATVPFPPDEVTARPNLVPGQPIWLDDPSVPGGRRLNRQAFRVPPPNTQGDLPRGSIRGFNARQLDLAVRRDLPLLHGIRLQLRAEIFNLFNTPNFHDPNGWLVDPQFGVSQETLARGFGGLNAQYQVGGPRSMQLAAKVSF